MRLSQGSTIDGFRILTKADIKDNTYISPRRKDDEKTYATVFKVKLSKFLNLGYGNGVIKFNLRNLLQTSKVINCECELRIAYYNETFEGCLYINNSSHDLTNILSARIILDSEIISVYCVVEELNDSVICNVEHINFISDNIKYGDFSDIVMSEQLELTQYRTSGEDVTIVNNSVTGNSNDLTLERSISLEGENPRNFTIKRMVSNVCHRLSVFVGNTGKVIVGKHKDNDNFDGNGDYYTSLRFEDSNICMQIQPGGILYPAYPDSCHIGDAENKFRTIHLTDGFVCARSSVPTTPVNGMTFFHTGQKTLVTYYEGKWYSNGAEVTL